MAEDALEVGVIVLNHYEKFFAAPYPLPKMDLLAVPDFAAGAMENWGLVTFRYCTVLAPNFDTPILKKLLLLKGTADFQLRKGPQFDAAPPKTPE